MRHFVIFLSLFLSLVSCSQKEKKHLSKIKGSLIGIDSTFKTDSKIDAFISPYRKHLQKEMNEVLSHTDKNLGKRDGKMESTLGNLLADLCYEEAQPIFKKQNHKSIDFTLLNVGGIRADISKGAITMADAFRVMPFENSLVVVELSAEKITEMLQYLAEKQKAHPISKHVKLHVYKDGTYRVRINGKKLNPRKSYFVLTTDYLQNGGDRMNFFKNPIHLYKLNYKMRNAIIDYFKKKKHIKANLDKRFTSEK